MQQKSIQWLWSSSSTDSCQKRNSVRKSQSPYQNLTQGNLFNNLIFCLSKLISECLQNTSTSYVPFFHFCEVNFTYRYRRYAPMLSHHDLSYIVINNVFALHLNQTIIALVKNDIHNQAIILHFSLTIQYTAHMYTFFCF